MIGEMPEEDSRGGISILSSKVDIANVRLQFPSGCVVDLTASRVSTRTRPQAAPVFSRMNIFARLFAA